MGEIRKENLHESLIEYLNGLGLTEEQVQGLIDEGLVDVTTDVTNIKNDIKNVQQFKLTQDNGYSKVVATGSINDIVTPGFYVLSEGVTDTPFYNSGYRGWYHLEVIGSDSNWVKQTCTIFEATGYGTRMYIRGRQNGTWAPWREFIDSSVITVLNNSQLAKMTEDNGVCRGMPDNNANAINITGCWMGADVVNGPSGVTGQWIYLESFVHNDLYQMQRATDLHNSSIQWVRHKTGGNWSSWRRL
jgi:hypothetical protein